MTLQQWHDRLEGHFTSLARLRSDSELPVFALEHGLNPEELATISALLRVQLRSDRRLSPHWLLWTIYATERGYTYAGDEYWPSFEEHTPTWDFRDHDKIVPCFRKFHKTFNGVIPSGPWAMHFKIIAWPITHAILPQYLQHQFAKALYELRYHLASLGALEPARIGHLLAANADHASTRFQEFLQQSDLTGRIVLGLLGAAPKAEEELIYAPTLQRIVDDLGRVGRGREWLRETRRVVAERFKGVARKATTLGARSRQEGADHEPSVRPSLSLRCSGPDVWSVILEVPSFKDVAALNDELRSFLKGTRCQLSGGDMKPAGWLLSGSGKAVLKSWPNPEQPLIRFEREHGRLNHLLQSECRLSNGPLWIFRVNRDGIGREVISHMVRAGCNYIILSNKKPPDSPWMRSCTLACAGIASYRIDVPAALTVDDVKWLQRAGLKLARTIRVWPAGPLARDWDGEGYSEWLTTDSPCLGIVHDHPVDAYVVRLNDRSETTVKANAVGHPTFIRLPQLSRGRHTLRVTVRRHEGVRSISPSMDSEGVLVLNVRDPKPWVPGTTSHVGMSVVVEPHDPTLDEFWYEKVSLSILGPEGHHVSCTISLYRANDEEIRSDQMGSFDLPISSATWSRKLHEFVNNDARKWSYLEATSARVVIHADELGEFNLRLERQVKPLRWACRHNHRAIILRLIDELGREEATTIRHFPFRRPAQPQLVGTTRFLAGTTIEAPGGLTVAQNGQDCAGIVVSSPQIDGGLQGLGVQMDVTTPETADVDITSIIRLVSQWMEAELAGPLAGIRRDQVIKGLCHALYTQACGSNWARAEAEFLEEPQSSRRRDALVALVDRMQGFAIVLERDWGQIGPGMAKKTHWFAELASQFRVCSKPELAEFALRMASQPHRLAAVYADRLDGFLRQITEKAALLRAARLLALLEVAQRAGGPGSALPRWTWRS